MQAKWLRSQLSKIYVCFLRFEQIFHSQVRIVSVPGGLTAAQQLYQCTKVAASAFSKKF
jgi:hypothetical protein